MESRFRKLLSSKKSRSHMVQRDSELDLRSIPYTTAPSQGRLPLFINHALGRPSTSKSKASELTDAHSFSYLTATPGTPPLLGDKPQHGNGPVKLQTSRRLSSGELLVTQQDYDRTLQDIRHGEYIVGGKERRTSRAQPPPPLTNLHQPKFVSTAPNSPVVHPSFPNPLLSPRSAHSDKSLPALPLHASSERNIHASVKHRFQQLEASVTSVNNIKDLHPSGLFLPAHMASTTSLLDRHEEQNPTVQALWKAEYGRLVAIYGQGGVDRHILDLNQSTSNLHAQPHSQILTRNESPRLSSPILQPNSPSQFERERRGLTVQTDSSTSHQELDHSDSSSNIRCSLLSSCASSSFTARTSITEESTNKREDIRRIVDDMRMTYLNAIEAHTPPLQPLPEIPTQNLRSKKKPRSLASSASVESGLRSMNRQSGSRSRSWQSVASTQQSTTPRTSMSSPSTKSLNKRKSSGNSRRTSGQPVAGISSLPAIEASPARSTQVGKKNKVDIGLKRADSTTLGSMERMLTIVDDRTSSSSPDKPIPQSTRILESVESEGAVKGATSPLGGSSIQGTPEKPAKTHAHMQSALRPSWHVEAEQLFADTQVDVSLDIDTFEALCNDLFNTEEARKDSNTPFQTWGNLAQRDSNSIHTECAPDTPTKHQKSTTPAPTGLGLSILSATG